MTLFKRRRLLFWLVQAYVRKSRKTIFVSFVVGLILFVLVRAHIRDLVKKIPLRQKTVIGVVGAYNVDNLPEVIVAKLSQGLTKLSADGVPVLDAARDFRIRDSGKTYDFLLKRNTLFSDGSELTSRDITFNFSDVTIERPLPTRVIFHLKESYSPFMTTLTRPILKNNFVGIGSATLSGITVNGSFVQTLSITDKNSSITDFVFYPTVEAVKTAFLLGEVTRVNDLSDLSISHTSFSSFPNVSVSKTTDYTQLVTLFYNTKDQNVNNRRLREALSYAIPSTFSQGVRNTTPYSPSSWVSENGTYQAQEDIEHAKLLLSQDTSGQKPSFSFTLKTLPELKEVAKTIANEWSKIGVNVSIVSVDAVPSDFQIFLGKFTLPKDPDQYTLWHSGQQNNITNYDNKRIDKLLEDGRETTDIDTRKKIYVDFQKYLLDDPPATFLFFPYTYSIQRK